MVCVSLPLIFWSHNRPEDFSDEGEQDIAAEGHIQELENANIAMALANATQQCMTLSGTDTPESENEDECDNFFEEGFKQQFDDDVADWVMTNDEMLVDGCGLSAEELLGEDFEHEAANSGELEVSVVCRELLSFYISLTVFVHLMQAQETYSVCVLS